MGGMGQGRPIKSGYWHVSWDVVDLYGDFPMCGGSGTGVGGTTIGFGVERVPDPCPVK